MANNNELKKKLDVENLTVSFRTTQGMVRAVRGIDFELYEKETLAIVGESGSGKSVSCRTIMGILAGNGVIDDGRIMYEGQDLTKVDEDHFHELRGNKIGMIFQDPMSSLNPIMRIGKQITEGLLLNGKHLKNRIKALSSEEKITYTELKKDKEEYVDDMKKKLNEAKDDDSVDEAALKAEYKGKVAEFNQQIREARKTYRKTKWKARFKVWKEWRAEKKRVHALIDEVKKDLPDVKDRLAEAKREKRALRKSLLESGKSGDELKNDDSYKKAVKHVEEIEFEKQIIKDHVAALKENLRRYKKVTKREAKEHALRIMGEVGIPQPKKRFRQYPFQFSGGMRQRIVIAIALTANPDILICDEPTTALDVTIQAQILDLINDLKEKRNLSVIFITHDLGVVANMADRIAVMYAGKIVEYGTNKEIFYDPKHPYTWALMSSVPDLESKEKLVAIPGTPPNMLYPPKGDAFADRNQYAMKIDFEEEPPMFKISDTHYAATWLLHRDAPEVEMPEIVKVRIQRMLEEHEEAVKEVKENAQI